MFSSVVKIASTTPQGFLLLNTKKVGFIVFLKLWTDLSFLTADFLSEVYSLYKSYTITSCALVSAESDILIYFQRTTFEYL